MADCDDHSKNKKRSFHDMDVIQHDETLLPSSKKQKLNEKIAIFSSPTANQNIFEGHDHFCGCNDKATNCLFTGNKCRFIFERIPEIDSNSQYISNTDNDANTLFEDDNNMNIDTRHWNSIQIAAYNRRWTDSNAFYYRFNTKCISSKTGPWDMNEHKLFMKRAMEIGVNKNKWGIFSKSIPGRVGYDCSKYWRALMKKKWVKDMNYFMENNRIHPFRNAMSHDHEMKKYSFIILEDPSKTFDSVPMYHPKCPSDKELLTTLKYIGVYMENIPFSLSNFEIFCKYLVECNQSLIPEFARIIYDYLSSQHQIGWIAKWAVDILAPLIHSHQIEICREPKSVSLHQIEIKLKSKDNSWPNVLQPYINEINISKIYHL